MLKLGFNTGIPPHGVIPDDGAKYTTRATRIVGHEKMLRKTNNTFQTKKTNHVRKIIPLRVQAKSRGRSDSAVRVR